MSASISVHLEDEPVRASVESNRAVHGTPGHYVTIRVGYDVTLFCEPQQAIEIGRALIESGIQAQQANDVEAATKAALSTPIPTPVAPTDEVPF